MAGDLLLVLLVLLSVCFVDLYGMHSMRGMYMYGGYDMCSSKCVRLSR